MKKGLLIAAGLIALPIVAGAYATFSSVVTAPGRVVAKTLETGNIISSYEWFHDTNAQFNVRSAQVAAHAGILSVEADPAEKTRLRIELASLRASCLDLANRYNANATKANKSIFRGTSTPESLNPASCQ